MKRIITKVKCTGCGTFQTVAMREPKFMEPTHHSFKCEVCESWVLSKNVLNKDNRGKIDQIVNIRPSETLLSMKRGEREAKMQAEE